MLGMRVGRGVRVTRRINGHVKIVQVLMIYK